MKSRPLLHNQRHRAMITPVLCVVVARLIHISRITGQFIVGLKLFSNGYCPLVWNSNPM